MSQEQKDFHSLSIARMSRIVIIVLTLLMFCNHIEGSCRTLKIKTILKDKTLTNHTIRTIQPITDYTACLSQCFLESLCFGVNFCVDQDDTATCELTNSDHIRSGADLVEKPRCTFYGTESGCSSNPCASNATCQADFLQDAPSYRCICPAGYTGLMCQTDLDECTLNTHNCHVNATCTNNYGGYNCTCKSGFYGNGTSCFDIDECAWGVHGCNELANCTNFPGGHKCTCKTGFHGDGKACVDLDECAFNVHECHMYANCTNNYGGYNCTCKTGFYGNGTSCYDIDECALGVHTCGELTTCTNLPGGHQCSCKAGFHGDGKVCVDLDECTLNVHECHVNAMCNNTYGGYNCTCKKGFNGNGKTCNDSDECNSGDHGCHVDATCINTIGGYNCKCNAPSYGNGMICMEPENCTELKSLLNRVGQKLPQGGIIGQGMNRRFCVFSNIPGCDAGPWTLAMKIDGSMDTFEYESPLWTNTLTLNPQANDQGIDKDTETKSSAFWNTPLKKICLGMKYGGVKRWMSFDIQANSLYDVFNEAKEITTQVGEQKWRTLLPPEVTSLQKKCSKVDSQGNQLECIEERNEVNGGKAFGSMGGPNKPYSHSREGFNLDGGTNARKRLLRLGLFKDNNRDCLSYSSFIGLGVLLENIDDNEIPTCGNFASKFGNDNGYMATQAFCYVLVQ